ncbi:MAG: hypothetical protein IT566_06485 [Rhodospirillaceae bacterium]|nr:hypothetical protein [Rhodospirillaceae bacterium]
MTPERKRAEKAFNKADSARTATAKRDEAFLTERRLKEAANLKRTLELRALRLAHEAANPKPRPAPRKRAQPAEKT